MIFIIFNGIINSFNNFQIFLFFSSSGDGLIQEKELQHVMRACMDENGMKFDEGEVDDLTRALFHDATMITNASRKASSCCGAAAAVAVAEQAAAEAAFTQPRFVIIGCFTLCVPHCHWL